jgi:hypothetical protein
MQESYYIIWSSVGLGNGQILWGGVEFAISSSQWEAKACCPGLINKKQANFDQIHSENAFKRSGFSIYRIYSIKINLFLEEAHLKNAKTYRDSI